MKVQIHPPDGAQPEEVTLDPGASLLVGRAPDPAALRSAESPTATQTLVLPSGLVSSNHLALWALSANMSETSKSK